MAIRSFLSRQGPALALGGGIAAGGYLLADLRADAALVGGVVAWLVYNWVERRKKN